MPVVASSLASFFVVVVVFFVPTKTPSFSLRFVFKFSNQFRFCFIFHYFIPFQGDSLFDFHSDMICLRCLAYPT